MEIKTTPLMQQYHAIKENYPDSLLLFQVGDFYELFFQDAHKASSFLAIALTKRGKNNGEDIPLCGIPVHALNHYLTKLVKGGFNVAICDQIGEPKPGTVVKRAVSRVLTPGTLTDTTMLDAQSPSYLFSLFPGSREWGLIFSELLTAQMFATCVPAGDFRLLEAEVIRFLPDEVILPLLKESDPLHRYFKQQGYPVSIAPNIDYVGEPVVRAWIEKQFGHAQELLKHHEILTPTLSLTYAYLKKHQEQALDHLTHLAWYAPEDYLVLDAATQRNLELVKNSTDGGKKNTLFGVLDGALTAMGSRTIKKWLLRPLVQRNAIEQRLAVVSALVHDIALLHQFAEALSQIADLERIVGRIALGRAHIHDYLALKQSLSCLPTILGLLRGQESIALFMSIKAKFFDATSLISLLEASLQEDGSYLIKRSFDSELDRLRSLQENGKQALLDLQQEEIKRSGISSLKIAYNQVVGYYFEVTNPNMAKVPDDFQELQMLSNRKRFVTPRLKVLESDLNRAHTQIERVEKEVYERIKREVFSYVMLLRQQVHALAYLDALVGFARIAYNNRYVAPQFHDTRAVSLVKGRHPVVELVHGTQFIANDTCLTAEAAVWIITGPNMGGKSTYLRQVALMAIMAQCGSMVPATVAHLPIFDRVFTRIGAGDNVAEGKSTFLVEMEETAVICTQATSRSLVILDEVGRGTSTYDGMALAQAIIEYIHAKIKTFCLFATHYHELTLLAEKHASIVAYHMKSMPTDRGIVFLHEIAPGVAAGSFGLEVAKLALLPDEIVKRATTILHEIKEGLHDGSRQSGNTLRDPHSLVSSYPPDYQSIGDILKAIDLDTLSPRQAFDVVWKIKQEIDKIG